MQTITYKDCLLQNTLFYEHAPLLTYQIHYPVFQTEGASPDMEPVNRYYGEKAAVLENYCKKELFGQAVTQYNGSVKSGYTMNPYEALQTFCVTELTDQLLSLYYDQYLYTGGAHGSTTRFSNVWDLNNGIILTLKDFFHDNAYYKEKIMDAVTCYIAGQMALPEEERTADYFDNYQKNVRDNFNENNFYLTSEGVVVYYGQYALAPYADGIQQFLIPFEKEQN